MLCFPEKALLTLSGTFMLESLKVNNQSYSNRDTAGL